MYGHCFTMSLPLVEKTKRLQLQKKKSVRGKRSSSRGYSKLRSVTVWSVAGSSRHGGTMDSTTTGCTSITAGQGSRSHGTITRERAPPGMLRSLPTLTNGLQIIIMGGGKTGGRITDLLTTSSVGCPGSAEEAVVMESMARTTYHNTLTEAGATVSIDKVEHFHQILLTGL